MEKLKRNEPCTLKTKVMQFGEGNFLRGFVDWMIDRLNKEADWNGGVAVVQPLAGGMVDKINEQDGLYHLYLRGLSDGERVEETRVVECIKEGINPYKDTDRFFALAEDDDLRFIVSNTTEAGIEYKSGQSGNDFENNTFPGRLTMFLKRRYDLGKRGFILLPCELIDRNGDRLKECVLSYAADWGCGEEFVKWINEENIFTNTLVDRIVTGYPHDSAEAMEREYGCLDSIIDTAEIFNLWVIEGPAECAEEIPAHRLDGVNVLWTDDVSPYKKRKVRILNGAHTLMVPAAILAGLESVGEAMNDELIFSFMKGGIYNEIIPTLDLPKNELLGFAGDVIERFRNPFIKHLLSSIALNSVSKFAVRDLPSLLEYIRIKGEEPIYLTFSLAALIAFYKTGEANDSPEVMSFMKNASPKEILSRVEYWGEDISFLLPTVEKYLRDIGENGVRDAMLRVVSG